MEEHVDFLRNNLLKPTEFALIGLPQKPNSPRTFYTFTKDKQGSLVNKEGVKLTIKPFLDTVSKKSPDTTSAASMKDHFLNITQNAINAIHAKDLKKVVLARTKTIEGVSKEASIQWYKNLSEAYPTALVFFISTHESGVWIGATPELLIEKTGNRFHTIALAGTSNLPSPDWSLKDYDEHNQVVSFLSDELNKLNVEDLRMTEPHSTRYGALFHLKTGVSFLSTLGLQDVVNVIHPTPALCGYPKEKALEYIQQSESFPREFYTGSIVIESPNGDGISYAFLRCGKLLDDSRLVIYAGCGIVGDSIPQKEWGESEAKATSILSYLPRRGSSPRG